MKGDDLTKKIINTGKPWESKWKYSQAIKVGNTVYLAGQISFDFDGNLVGPGDIKVQAKKTFENIQDVLKAAGAEPRHVVRQHIYVPDASLYPVIEEEAAAFYQEHYPAQTLIVCKEMGLEGLLLEVECTAVIDD